MIKPKGGLLFGECGPEHELVKRSWKAYSNYIPSMSDGIFLDKF
jgi:hypothetical protein